MKSQLIYGLDKDIIATEKNAMIDVNESKELINRLKAIAERITDHGRIAAKQGVSIDENPWKGFNHEYHIWRRGWIFETNELETNEYSI